MRTQWRVVQHRVTEMKAALGAAEALRNRACELAFYPGTDTAKSMYAMEAQKDRMTIRAPAAGLVVNRAINLGEMASAGGTLVTLANLDEVRLTIYVPESDVGKVRVGQRAQVMVDSFPDREFEGRVTFVSSQAEFTPKSVQTEKSRVYTVFAVRITVPNPDHALKPGMPADAGVELGT